MAFDYKKRIVTPIDDSAIGSLLNKMSLESVFCTHSSFSEPWGISMPQMDNCMMFHLVIDGSAVVTVDDNATKMHTGDFVLLPRGEGHQLSCGNTNMCTPLEALPIEIVSERFERLTFGGGGQPSILLCGAIVFKHPLTLRLLGLLPDLITVKNDSQRGESIKSLVNMLQQETKKADMAASGAISRLADLLVISSLREYLELQQSNQFSWVGALEDKRISKAIELVHKQPSRHWSLEELGSEVGMSRTSFAVEFKRLVGNSPMEYLTEWRMSLAYSDLQNTQSSILTIALDYGYQSESAFSRAFKKTTGFSPSAVRKTSSELS